MNQGEQSVEQVLSQIDKKCDGHPDGDTKKLLCHHVFEVDYGNVCELDRKIEINSTGFEVIANEVEHVQLLVIIKSQHVEYLPLATEYLSHLIEYWATNNRIKAIFKENFMNMRWLEKLTLGGNRISTIDDNTFSGLQRLKTLDLGEKF